MIYSPIGSDPVQSINAMLSEGREVTFTLDGDYYGVSEASANGVWCYCQEFPSEHDEIFFTWEEIGLTPSQLLANNIG